MGLDATVYCNCFESGRLEESPPNSSSVYVAPDGSLDCKSEDLEALLVFDTWLRESACEHKDGVLQHHYIGNLALVGLLREELKRESEKFPTLIEKILYSGTHAGDYLSLADVFDLQVELKALAEFAASDEKKQVYVEGFRLQMQELIGAALSVGKPISF
jgi:hypothetical protein